MNSEAASLSFFRGSRRIEMDHKNTDCIAVIGKKIRSTVIETILYIRVGALLKKKGTGSLPVPFIFLSVESSRVLIGFHPSAQDKNRTCTTKSGH